MIIFIEIERCYVYVSALHHVGLLLTYVLLLECMIHWKQYRNANTI